jgi:hypothetical protein
MLLGQTTARSLSLSLITCSPVHVVKSVLGFHLLLKSKKLSHSLEKIHNFLHSRNLNSMLVESGIWLGDSWGLEFHVPCIPSKSQILYKYCSIGQRCTDTYQCFMQDGWCVDRKITFHWYSHPTRDLRSVPEAGNPHYISIIHMY